MNATPRANRPHIAIFGRRNAGKSSLINCLTGQTIALVSEHAGTTTDPVYKNIEILPLGPCVLIDTAGIDDEGILGSLRVQKTREVLAKTDLALLVIDAHNKLSNYELEIIKEFRENKISFIAVLNKIDLPNTFSKSYYEDALNINLHEVSCINNYGINSLKDLIAQSIPSNFEKKFIVGDLLTDEDICVLVTPIDSSAPKGRLILPQVQTLRDILDSNAITVVTKETQLKKTLDSLKTPPRLVITDSQAFAEVANVVPDEIPLTSFSILYARYKGDLNAMLTGVDAVKSLKAHDKVLIAEACTHHQQEDDIGTVKIPRMLKAIVKDDLDISWYKGFSYPEDLKDYKLVIHCGACMLNQKQMMTRIHKAQEANVPLINYGIFWAYATGILPRALQPFNIKI